MAEILRDIDPRLQTVTSTLERNIGGPDIEVEIVHLSEIDRIEGLAQECADTVIGEGALVNVFVDVRTKGKTVATTRFGESRSIFTQPTLVCTSESGEPCLSREQCAGQIALSKVFAFNRTM